MRFLRAVEQRPSPRDQALGLIPFYAGARIAETVGLDVDDVKISARKGTLRILGKGEKVREVPLHPSLRAVLTNWLAERGDWPGSGGPALFLNQKGSRLSARGASDIITAIAASAHLDDEGVSAHSLRHTFVTTLEGRGVASDATFRVRREDGPAGAADSVPPRPQPIMNEKVQVRQAHEGEVAAGDSMCHRVLLHRKTA